MSAVAIELTLSDFSFDFGERLPIEPDEVTQWMARGSDGISSAPTMSPSNGATTSSSVLKSLAILPLLAPSVLVLAELHKHLRGE